eukprot:COSAG02_NODE_1587_length_11808_cov_8.640875_4_plen_373_part_00
MTKGVAFDLTVLTKDGKTAREVAAKEGQDDFAAVIAEAEPEPDMDAAVAEGLTPEDSLPSIRSEQGFVTESGTENCAENRAESRTESTAAELQPEPEPEPEPGPHREICQRDIEESRGESRGEPWVRGLSARRLRDAAPVCFGHLAHAEPEEEDRVQILKDLPRTFPEHPLFAVAVDPGKDGDHVLQPSRPDSLILPLQRVLTALVVRKPGGYTQGMNYIAAVFLLAGVAEEDTFWCIVAIAEVAFPNFYSGHLSGTKVENAIINSLLKVQHPRLYRHLAELRIPLELFTTEVRSQNAPPSTVLVHGVSTRCVHWQISRCVLAVFRVLVGDDVVGEGVAGDSRAQPLRGRVRHAVWGGVLVTTRLSATLGVC